jgi:hypothetical protein
LYVTSARSDTGAYAQNPGPSGSVVTDMLWICATSSLL